MQLLLVLAVLAALVIAEHSPHEPVHGVGSRLLAATLGMSAVALFAAATSGVIARGVRRHFHRRHLLLRRFNRLRRLHAILWLGVAGAILYGLDWAQLVRFNWNLRQAILVDELLILTPVLLPLVLSWAAFFEVDRAVRIGLAEGQPTRARTFGRRAYLTLHARHYLGLLLVPVLGLVAVQDAAELIAPGVLKTVYAAVVYVPAMVLLVVLFPCLLRGVWSTRPLEPGPLRTRLEAAARRAGLRVREILAWQTGGTAVNAAVAGFWPSLRYVFLTDGLLSRLTDEDIEAVFSHEMGHIRHRHLLLRMSALIAPVCLWFLAQRAFPEAVGRLEEWIAGRGVAFQASVGLLMLGSVVLYVVSILGVYWRLLEAEADLFACENLTRPTRRDRVRAFTSALEKLAAAGGVDRRARSWQHGSIARRVAFLNRVACDPRYQRRFRRQVGAASCLVVLAVLGLLVCLLVGY
ncbi:MAG: M48 family metallopeptidase [Planctomycetota bacterium]|jgi:STE24 endopeptidase